MNILFWKYASIFLLKLSAMLLTITTLEISMNIGDQKQSKQYNTETC